MLEPMQLALRDVEPVPAPRGSLCRPLPSAARPPGAAATQPPLRPLSRKLLLPISHFIYVESQAGLFLCLTSLLHVMSVQLFPIVP